ncbi:sulfatase-like hydrolase/transferase [Ruficoccus sp. ZRK36]|uniref:sulfatase-like hydrolase/transferase n=1 Tax=Ruficoccus sp. ZRK36 TaxID=2866311 RepID=UPI001C737B54|nr:sulfatase-like hydrolase/transferase [Ruficoccus sp. ZRK36]QYY36523.1 sulfatase-like hydrolase/transferase [Ruficoccus sp. ZRK36]
MKWIQTALQTFLLPCLTAACLSLHGADQPRPNILFIFSDDQRADALGAVNPDIVTPHLDSLAKDGVVFDRAYVTTAICSPSRASTLTGRYGTRNGVSTLSAALNEGERTFAQYLGDVGYRTAQFGKWHIKTTPAEAAFQSYAQMYSNGSWYHRNIDSNIPGAPKALNGRFYEEVMADMLIDYIDESASSGQPFVAWWCNQVPHLDEKMQYPDVDDTQALYDPADMRVPTNWADEPSAWTVESGERPPYLAQSRFVSKSAEENYGGPGGYDNPAPGIRNRTVGEDNVQNHLREYYAAVTALDRQIGRVLARLKDPNGDGDTSDSIANNTWIIFMGDNGWFTGHHRFTSKVLPYEEASRVPMLVWGPGVSPRTESHLVLNIDLTRLILDIAGTQADTSHMQGLNLRTLIDEPDTNWRESVYLEGVISEPSLGAEPFDAVVKDHYKLIRTYADSSGESVVWLELYDLETDPDEMHNLSNDPAYASIRDDLTRSLVAQKSAIAASPNATPKP